MSSFVKRMSVKLNDEDEYGRGECVILCGITNVREQSGLKIAPNGKQIKETPQSKLECVSFVWKELCD